MTLLSVRVTTDIVSAFAISQYVGLRLVYITENKRDNVLDKHGFRERRNLSARNRPPLETNVSRETLGVGRSTLKCGSQTLLLAALSAIEPLVLPLRDTPQGTDRLIER